MRFELVHHLSLLNHQGSGSFHVLHLALVTLSVTSRYAEPGLERGGTRVGSHAA